MRAALLLPCCAVLCLPTTALAWSPFRVENPSVKKGNELMAQEQYPEALEAYDQAARELPEARAVQLNRGLAQLSQGLTEPAKESFTAATDPSAPAGVRADAYYDLGIVHAREGNGASEQEDFEQASAHFREAAEAFKRALRARPGDRNAAWNLEYALERIREEEQKQEQQQQNQDEDQNQSENQNEDEPGSENEPQDEDQNGPEDQNQSENQNEDEPGTENEPRPEPQMQRSEVERFLDALEQNEESLPLQRARQRSAGRRPPEKDW